MLKLTVHSKDITVNSLHTFTVYVALFNVTFKIIAHRLRVDRRLAILLYY